MANVHLFPRYTGPENFTTNNTLLLISRIYQTDYRLFEMLLNKLLDGGEIQVGPSFVQQISSGGDGIPDAIIEQSSFKLVIETKLSDKNFWGKEDYVSHFKGERKRILFTISKNNISKARELEIRNALKAFDKQVNAEGDTIHRHQTFTGLIKLIQSVLDETNSLAKFQLKEVLEDYAGFAHDLIY